MFVQSLLPYGSGSDWIRAVESLHQWIVEHPGPPLFRVNPRAVARDLELPEGLVVDIFLGAVLEGWFDLRWDFHCPQCWRLPRGPGVPGLSDHLHGAHSTGFCPTCQAEFHNELDRNTEVTFTAAPQLAAFAPGELDALLQSYQESLGPEPRLDLGLSGLDLLHRPLFRLRFGDEVLSREESLEVRSLVFLFTDIKGSTRLYEQLGDAKAYHLVREHFKVLFGAIEARGGVVVKTIGDAVMASFRRPVEALEASLEVQGAIAGLKVPGTDDSVVVKMGIHAGPVLAVTLNDRFDYFGQTVNRAARIQGLAEDQEIYFSEVVFRDSDCRRTLAARKAAVRRSVAQLRGIDGDQVVYSVK